MYRTFFGLNEPPFSISPDPSFLYLSESHKEALARMIYGVHERKGFTVITGDVGTGKTTLVNRFLQGLDPRVKIISINNPELSRADFFYIISRAVGLEDGLSKARFLAAFENYLRVADAARRPVLLIVDEAQNLPGSLLEEIRLLSNLETASRKLLQIVLVGQQELNGKLASPSLRQLKQRISQKFHIAPLDREETVEYIAHRLGVAGYCGGQLFESRALARIHDFTGGYPRLINVLCDNLLLSAYARELHRVGPSLVKEVTHEMQAAYSQPVPSAPSRPQARAQERVLYGLVGLAVILFLLAMYRVMPGW
jgi:general secretion pathway protein A